MRNFSTFEESQILSYLARNVSVKNLKFIYYFIIYYFIIWYVIINLFLNSGCQVYELMIFVILVEI